MPLSASWLMVVASFLFATMSLCVKLAGAYYSNGQIVMFRGLIGAVVMLVVILWRRQSLATPVPGLHLRRSFFGVTALSLWFGVIGGLPLATAVTLNYMSSIWMAVFLIGAALWTGRGRVEPRLALAVLVGFAGVAAILRPSIERDQWVYGVMGLGSGVMSALAYLQVKSLGQAGEPEDRVVFYFSCGGVVAGLFQMAVSSLTTGGGAPAGADPGWQGPLALLGVGVTATVAQLAMTRAYAQGRALVNASLQYLGIAFSFLYGVLLFDDPVHLSALVGMVLVVSAGVAATRWGTAGRRT